MKAKPSPAKAAKAERRSRREARSRGARKPDWTVTHLGGAFDPVAIRQTVDAFLGFDPGGRWEDVRPLILPLLRRVRHPFPPDAAPVELLVPPGITTGFGIDVGPALAYVSSVLMSRWSIDEATLLGTALDNLRRRVTEEPPRIDHGRLGGAPVTVVQAQGWGSALILAPDRLEPLIGGAPRVLLTPIRNTLVALPEDVDPDLALMVWETLAEQARDELDVVPLRWTGSTVVLGEAADHGWVH